MSARKVFVVDQNGGSAFNHAALKRSKWHHHIDKRSIPVVAYSKEWSVQEPGTGPVMVKVSMIAVENIAAVFVNNRYIGRVLTLREANAIVSALRTNAK